MVLALCTSIQEFVVVSMPVKLDDISAASIVVGIQFLRRGMSVLAKISYELWTLKAVICLQGFLLRPQSGSRPAFFG